MKASNFKIIVFFIFVGYNLSSQELHFSQFNETPALVNPALTGSSGTFRASVISKDQWKSVTNAYKTYGANLEMPINLGGLKKGNRRSTVAKEKIFGGLFTGVSFFSDKAGDGSLSVSKINLSVSSFVRIAKHHSISVGMQGSYIQRRLDYGNLIFPNQYNGASYDPNQSSKENFLTQRYTNIDAAAGVLWSFDKGDKSFEKNQLFSSHVGFSMYHLTQSKDKFISNPNGEYFKFVAHGDMIKSLGSSNIALSPSFLFQMQGTSKELLVGTLVRHYFNGNSKYTGMNKRNSFCYGLYWRTDDAIIVSTLIELIEQYSVIFGYEVNISSLKSASSKRGGFEIGLRYTAPKKSALYQRK